MEKILINIDSRQRDYNLYPSSSFFRVGADSQPNSNFANLINFKNIDYIKLASAEIPNNFYIFHDTRFNNYFKLKLTLNDGATPNPNLNVGNFTINIPNGTYDADVLANALNIILKNNNLSIGTINSRGVITVTDGIKFSVNPNTSKFTISNLTNDYTFEIDFNNNNIDYISFGYIIGFRQKKYEIIEQDYIVSEAASDVTGEKYIFLRVNNFGMTYINHKNPRRVLAKIVLDKYKEDFIYNNNNDQVYKEHKFRLPIDITRLELELLDYTGKRIDNNGLDFSITLEFGQIYDERLYKKAFDYIKINDDENILSTIENFDKHATVNETNEKTKILDNIFEKQPPQIINVPEIINLEEKRKKTQIRKKKKKFDFTY